MVVNNPRDLANHLLEQIQAEIKDNTQAAQMIAAVEVAGPGFINFKLSEAFLKTTLKQIAQEADYGYFSQGQSQTWEIEHTSPNPNKAMHLGHLRNNVTAMAVSSLWEAVGVKVIREAVDNNRGISIAKLMWGYLKFAYKNKKQITDLDYWYQHQDEWLTPQEADQRSDRFVDQLYVQAAQDYEENEEAAARVKQMVIDWENNHQQTRALWEKVMQYSHQGQALTLERLGNQWDHVWHEHEHYELGKDFVQKGLKQGIFRQLEDGAVLTDLKDYDLPDTILQKSDGTSLYITQDIALTYLKKQKYKADKMFWVVGPEQNLALRQMFAVCDQLGIADYKSLTHLSYGYMSLKNQGKMSSRSGNVIYIDDLIDEAKRRVQQKMNREGLSQQKIEVLSEQVALAAVKYSILRVGRQTDMAFDFETALSLDGNSGPYLQYTHARAHSVLKRAKDAGDDRYSKQPTQENIWLGLELQPEEQDLLRYIYRWPEVVEEAGFNYEPSTLSTFLYQLAQKYNSFYNKRQILVEDEEIKSFRLTMTQAVKQVLAQSLQLLGMSAPERM